MDEVEDSGVDLIISGPPYWDYLNYGAFAAGKRGADIRWNRRRTYSSFLNDLGGWYQECFRVLRSGRFCVVNVGTLRKDGRTYPIPFHAVGILEKIGFAFCYEILWHKLSGGRPDARGIISHPFPGRYIPNNRVEYLLVFRKDPETPFENGRPITPDEQIDITDLFKRETANNVWHIPPATYPLSGDHPCPFPPEIPHRLIELLSRVGETVLDPFMGIGTTARAARMLNRHFIGYELEEQFVKIAKSRVDLPLRFRRPTVCRYGPL